MRNLDLNSLWRSTVGFDRLVDLIDESARWTGEENHYPPYHRRASRRRMSPSRQSRTYSPLRGVKQRKASINTSTRASRHALSAASSTSPTMSR